MKERVETILTVDSRSKNINNNYADDLDDYENEMIDPLEKVIQTKYEVKIFLIIYDWYLKMELGGCGLEWRPALRLMSLLPS